MSHYFHKGGFRGLRIPGKLLDRSGGVILLVTLWMVMIWTLLAVGMGRHKHIDFSLTRYHLGKLRAKYVAMAGVNYAMQQIVLDSKDEAAQKQDTPAQCGFMLSKEQTAEGLFKHVLLGTGYFDVGYTSLDQGKPVFIYGFQDEESKINLNAINSSNYGILSQLLQLLGYEEKLAEEIAAAVADWGDEDDVVLNTDLGAEKDYYSQQGLPYRCKNRPFESVEELTLIRGMSTEIFQKIKPFVTIFPLEGSTTVNFETASQTVLEALARNEIHSVPNTSMTDAHGLAEKVIAYRNGDDDRPGTADDQMIEGEKLGLNAREFTLWNALLKVRTKVSNHFRVQVRGVDEQSRVSSRVTAVIRRQDQAILLWHRQ